MSGTFGQLRRNLTRLARWGGVLAALAVVASTVLPGLHGAHIAAGLDGVEMCGRAGVPDAEPTARHRLAQRLAHGPCEHHHQHGIGRGDTYHEGVSRSDDGSSQHDPEHCQVCQLILMALGPAPWSLDQPAAVRSGGCIETLIARNEQFPRHESSGVARPRGPPMRAPIVA